MFGLTELKQTKVYQEAKEEGKAEGKLETIPFMLNSGITVEQIAAGLGLDVELVRSLAAQINPNQKKTMNYLSRVVDLTGLTQSLL